MFDPFSHFLLQSVSLIRVLFQNHYLLVTHMSAGLKYKILVQVLGGVKFWSSFASST